MGAQNKVIRFILNLDNRVHIGNQELETAGFLQDPDRVKQLKLGHVFRIKSKTCPQYLSANFQQLTENDNRMTTRAKAHNFYKPRMCTNTFAYSAIDEWNSLPNNVKAIKMKKCLKKALRRQF